MQIKKQTIILSSIAFLLLTGCSNLNTDLYIKNNTEDKIKFIEQNKDNKDDLDFFEKTDTKLFNSYNSKMLKNAKIRIVNREPVNSTTPIPAMYINTNSFEELASILDEVTGIYKIIFNEDARKYLTNTIKEESIIDMSKRNFTFFELIEKVAFKYDLYFERKDNTFYFKLYEEKKYHIPTNLTFNGKNTLAEHEKYSKVIINNIKKFMKNKNEDAIIYDDKIGRAHV